MTCQLLYFCPKLFYVFRNTDRHFSQPLFLFLIKELGKQAQPSVKCENNYLFLYSLHICIFFLAWQLNLNLHSLLSPCGLIQHALAGPYCNFLCLSKFPFSLWFKVLVVTQLLKNPKKINYKTTYYHAMDQMKGI